MTFSKINIQLFLALTMLFISKHAAAWVKWRDDSGDHRRIDNPVTMRIDTCSMISSNQQAVKNAMELWNDPWGITDMFSWSTQSSCSFDNDNGKWEIVGFPEGHDALDYKGYEATALTYCRSNEVTGVHKECDILFNRDLDVQVASETNTDLSILQAVAHELGHVLGMWHETTTRSIMHPSSTAGAFGGANRNGVNAAYFEGLAPDDIAYMLDQNPSSNAGNYDVYATAWHWNSVLKKSVIDDEKAIVACPGENVKVWFEFGTKGKLAPTEDNRGYYRIVLSTDQKFTLSDIKVVGGSRWSTSGHGLWGVWMDKNFVVPSSLVAGTPYYIGVIVDDGNTLVEDNEYNNSAYTRLILKRKSGC